MGIEPLDDRTRVSVLGDAGKVAVGVAIGQGLVLLATPVLTRIYDASTFGVFAVLTSIESLLVVAAALRLEQAVPLPERDEEGMNLVASALASLLAVTAVAAIVLYLFGGNIGRWTGAASVDTYIMLVPAVLVADGAFIIASYWAVRCRRFRTLSIGRLSVGGGQSLAQIGLGFATPTPLGIMGGVGIGRAVGAVALLVQLRETFRSTIRTVRLRTMWRVVVRYRRFPLFGGPAAVVNSAGLQAPVLLVAGLYGAAPAGFYLLATRMVALPIGMLGQATAQAYHGHAANLVRSPAGALRTETVRLARRLSMIGIPPAAAFAVLGPPLFAFVFGHEWGDAGEYVRILTPAFLAQFVVMPLAPALAVVERQDLQLAWDVGRLAVVISALAVPGVLGWSILGALTTLSVASSLMYMVLLALIMRALPRALSAQPSDQLDRASNLQR